MNSGTLRFVKEHQKLHTIYDSMGNEMAWQYTYLCILIGCVASYLICLAGFFFIANLQTALCPFLIFFLPLHFDPVI